MSSAVNWVYTFVSAAGTSHIKTGRSCQDYCTCEVIKSKYNEDILVAIASDGAGSAEYGETGSRLICNIIKEEIISFFDRGFLVKDITRETAAGWIKKFQEEVYNIAKDNGRSARDYACTLAGAIVGLHEEAYFQIGDGAVVVLPRYYPEVYKCIFWPQRGEYANTTFFSTDRSAVERYLEFKTGDLEGDEITKIAVFTDGIQQLALHYESKTPYAGFFEPMFKGLASLRNKTTNEINSILEVFLNSEKINSRTDDDKTLIMAARF